jgi:hypothetical protein
MRGLPLDLDGVNYARPLKVTKAKRSKKGVLKHILSGKTLRLLAKGKLMLLARAFCLSRGNTTFFL